MTLAQCSNLLVYASMAMLRPGVHLVRRVVRRRPGGRARPAACAGAPAGPGGCRAGATPAESAALARARAREASAQVEAEIARSPRGSGGSDGDACRRGGVRPTSRCR